MTREGMYILDNERSPLPGGSSAYPSAKRNADAGRKPLERAKYELCAVEQVEANPVHILKELAKKSRGISQISD
ncbi:hypothetical protein D3C85_1837910 [compost metagenome]